MPKGKGYGKKDKPKASSLGTGQAARAARGLQNKSRRQGGALAAAMRATGTRRKNQTTDSNN